jgi:RHS repeat-associated protein
MVNQLGFAQQTTIVENAQKSQYENTSYLIVGSLVLKSGFNFNASTQGTFFAKAYANDPNKAPSADKNFVRKESIFIEGIETDDDVLGLNIGKDKQLSYSYADGIGRKNQEVIMQASPAKKDLVQPIAYDTQHRPAISYLPYIASEGSGSFRSSGISEQSAFYNSPPSGVVSDSKAYATTTFDDSPLDRVLSISGVGNEMQTANASMLFKVNKSTDAVRKWHINNGLPKSTSTYPAGSLSIEETEDPSGMISQTFTDFTGKVILERSQATSSTWHNTYYVFNDYGELLFIIPPESSANLNPSLNDSDLWHFKYEYDDLGRQIGSKAPGANWLYTIYDRWDRPVLSQDGEQRNKSPEEWSYIKYDENNRPIISGVISTSSSRSTLTNSAANSIHRYESKTNSAIGYTFNTTFPLTANESGIMNITYYDDYSFLTHSGWSDSNTLYAFSTVSGYNEPQETAVKGLTTGSKARTQGTNIQWINTVTYYDDNYQPIQSISSHQMGGTLKTVTAYQFSGEVEKTLDLYTYTDGNTQVERRYTYDDNGRPLKVYHRVDNESEVMLSHFQYNELGEATDIVHHSRNDGATWLYKTHVKSTIQGWTDELTYSYANGDPVFHQKLDYHQSSGTGNTTRLDGLITANQWKHYGTEPERVYNYAYDTPKRLTEATYKEKSGSSWDSNNLYNENNINYSANGNIIGLSRNRDKSGTAATIDNLTYTYSGNKLTGVSDSAPSTHKSDGFDDGITSAIEYTYNKNGFLVSDSNKGINGITYTRQDLPSQIDIGTGNSIQYTYSAGGGQMTVNYQGNTGNFPNKTLQYVGELVFEGTTLKEISHGAGRVLVDGDFRYQYYLRDYLGNTRVVLQEDPANFLVAATFEEGRFAEESEQFLDYEESPRIAANLYDHTGTAETGQAIRLSDGMNGPARSIAVLPGDTIRMEVFGKYLDLRNKKTDPTLIALSLAMAATNPAAPGIDGNLSTAASRISGKEQGLAGLLIGKEKQNGAPPAYLNYLFFDKEMNYKYGGFTQMTAAAYEDGSNRAHERLYQEVVAEEPGYFYIYLSNDGTEGGEAYFDDFSILTLESYIVQQTDYYPYGLVARNFVRTGEKETLELFQGKTYDELTGWYDFHARQYDAALGRWFGVDAYTHSMPGVSPFTAMANNPVMFIDPDGNDPITLAVIGLAMLKGAAIGAGISAATYGISTSISGQSWNWGQFATQVGKGAALGGLTAGAGIGFSAGLNAMGVGAQSSNFIGGALGSFSGNLAVGGMPNSPVEWATAGLGAYIGGKAMQISNPLGLSNATEIVEELEGYLPMVTVTDKGLDKPWWWGLTNRLINEDWLISGSLLLSPNSLPLSSGAIYPNYTAESMAIGGIATKGVVNTYRFLRAARSSTIPLKSTVGAARAGFSKLPKGFKQTKQFGYQHGQKVYKYKGKFYSRDIDAHNGGVWKVFENVGGKLKRIGTADEFLNIFKQ